MKPLTQQFLFCKFILQTRRYLYMFEITYVPGYSLRHCYVIVKPKGLSLLEHSLNKLQYNTMMLLKRNKEVFYTLIWREKDIVNDLKSSQKCVLYTVFCAKIMEKWVGPYGLTWRHTHLKFTEKAKDNDYLCVGCKLGRWETKLGRTRFTVYLKHIFFCFDICNI